MPQQHRIRVDFDFLTWFLTKYRDFFDPIESYVATVGAGPNAELYLEKSALDILALAADEGLSGTEVIGGLAFLIQAAANDVARFPDGKQAFRRVAELFQRAIALDAESSPSS